MLPVESYKQFSLLNISLKMRGDIFHFDSSFLAILLFLTLAVIVALCLLMCYRISVCFASEDARTVSIIWQGREEEGMSVCVFSTTST